MNPREAEYFCIRVSLTATGASLQELVERVCARCWEKGAAGIEERGEAEMIELLVYAPPPSLEAVLAVARAEVSRAGVGEVADPETVDPEDWSQTWKEGIQAVEISPRLVVRPSFDPIELAPRQLELVIDPKQAFGTGGHVSTLLALEWIDALADEFQPGTRVLDIGTGTGVLALAALRLGAGEAVGFDIDRIAAREAAEWAEINGLASRFRVYAGGLEALGVGSFDLVVANLLRSEMLPLVPGMLSALARGAWLVVSGLLEVERGPVLEAFAEHGVGLEDARAGLDSGGQDRWVSLLLRGP
jgi:ribosomal protein L11 methyltransferase